MASPAPSRHKDVILSSAGITASLVLAEPVVYLYGFTKSEQLERPPAIVRGSLVLRITKPTKIKSISLKFRGISRTEWPEGIPSEKSETHETKEVFLHEWRLFSSHFSNAESSSGAHQVIQLDPETSATEEDSNGQSLLSAALHPTTTLAMPHALVNQHDAVNKGYRVFQAAEYVYNFELLLPQRLPETLKCNFGHVKWGFHLAIERHGTFKSKLTGYKDFTVLRSLGPSNLESSEPIVISRDWEDVLHYEIIIAGKAFAIGQTFNIAFALVPLAKVKCHRIRLYITEHVEYYCRNRRIHRVEPSHKFMLLERPPKGDGKTSNILEPAANGMSGLTELEFNVQIPESFPNRRDYLRPNANTEYIKVHHWIKAIMRLSRMDARVDGKPKCYEVSIDSPITLVDNRTTTANELPEYSGGSGNTVGDMVEELRPYQEFIQKGDPLSQSQRAILFARQPSIAPPPFDADVRPPQIQPPPTYDQLREDPESYQTRYSEHLRVLGQGSVVDPNTSYFGPSLDPRMPPEHAQTPESSASSRQSSETESPSTAPTSTDEVSATGQDGENVFGPGPVPVFSEIIWTEEEGGMSVEDDVDPHGTQITQREGTVFQNTPSPSGSFTAQPFMDAFVPRSSPRAQMPDRSGPIPGPSTAPAHGAYPSILTSSSMSVSPEMPSMPSMPVSPSAPISPAMTGPASIIASEHEAASVEPTISPGSHPFTPRSFTPTAATPFAASQASSPGPTETPFAPSAMTPHPLMVETGRGVDNGSDAETGVSEPVPRPWSRASGSFSRGQPFAMPARRGEEPDSPLSPRAGPMFPKRGTGAPTSAPSASLLGRAPPQMQMQRLRGMPVVPAGRQASFQSSKVSLKGSSQSAGSPLGSSWSDSNAGQLFGERWMDPSTSAGSQTNPRFFRQSSIVSIDLARQGEAAMLESRRASRRVSEVSEITPWYPLSRTNSESSVAVSVAEYEGFHDTPVGSQGRAPLLGDNESVDIATGIGHLDDYDYDFEDDRRSVSSVLYSVLTP